MQGNSTRFMLTIALLLFAIGLTALPACAQFTYIPYYPPASSVDMLVWPQGGAVQARVEVTLSSTCYTLNHWSPPQKNGNQITIDSIFLEQVGGPCLMIIDTVSQEFPLGTLSPGSYTLRFASWGQTIETLPFIVTSPKVTTIRGAKTAADGTLVDISAAVVTRDYGLPFYIAADDRSVGLRVEKSGLTLSAGMRADAAGIMQTADSGERCILAGRAIGNGSGSVNPLLILTKHLGGAAFSYNEATGAGQKGMTGGEGLNNIGLPVRIWGKIRQVSTSYPAYLYVDDGCQVVDGTMTGTEPNIGVRAVHSPDGHLVGDVVEVIGISSCFESGPGSTAPCLQAAGANDVRLIVR